MVGKKYLTGCSSPGRKMKAGKKPYISVSLGSQQPDTSGNRHQAAHKVQGCGFGHLGWLMIKPSTKRINKIQVNLA
jgi:hypothetical protein